MIRGHTALLLGLLAATPAFAQPLPFDMSPERQAEPGAVEKPPVSPPATATQPEPPAAPSSTSKSGEAQPTVTPRPAPVEVTPARQAPAGAPSTAAPTAPAQAAPAEPTEAAREPAPDTAIMTSAATPARRYLIPSRELVLDGETQRRSWSIFLTAEEAAAGRQIHAAYQNSIVVAPELSRLRLLINGAAVIDVPIQSSDAIAELAIDLPAGLLRPGDNIVVLEASMRHRTDCSIQSTYELWTELDPGKTFISFDPTVSVAKRRVDDLRALGVDHNGETRINIVAPGLDSTIATVPIIRLAEGVAMSANMPNPKISVSRQLQDPQAGGLTAYIGTPDELRDIPGAASVAASSSLGFAEDGSGGGALIVTGQTWNAIGTAVESIVTSVDRPRDTQRLALSTHNWRLPDAPLYANGGSATFSELGVPTQEFTGRRFRTEFAFGIPSDFYANDYGEATLLLDAAYSPSVLPGSHIDVYVNGNIASTLPVSQAGGAILRQLPISVTMRHLKPGVNIVTLEAVLLTESDAVCAPGTTAGTDPRFVIFETSKLEVPRFARVARRPNLSGLVGTGFPYNIAADRVPLILEPSEPDALSAAAALLGSMSVAGGRAIAVDVALSPSVANGRDAIFVGSIGRVPAETLSHFGISPESQVSWAGAARPAQETSNGADTQATFDRWRKELSGSGWRGRVSSLEEWLSRNFDFTVGSLFSSGETTAYVPKQDASIMLAQQASTGDTGTWTLLTAPSARQLRDGMQGLAALNTWRRVDGRITTLNGQSDSLTVVPLSKFEFVPTQPTSIINYRLILANWLSANVLVFAGWLVVMCTILGLATASLLSAYGRRT